MKSMFHCVCPLLALIACQCDGRPIVTHIVADKEVSSVRPAPPVPERIAYHLIYLSASHRLHSLPSWATVSSVFPPIATVQLGYFDQAGNFQTTPECRAHVDAPKTDVARHECTITLLLGETAIFGVQAILHTTVPEAEVKHFLPLNADISAPMPPAASLRVLVEGKSLVLLPVPHQVKAVSETPVSKLWDITDQWVASTPCPERLPRKVNGVCVK